MKKIAIILLFIFPVNLFGGYNLNNDKCSNDLEFCNKELSRYKLLTESLYKSIGLYKKNEDLYQQKITALDDQNLKLTKALEDAREVSTFEKIGLILLGAVTAGGVIYGAKVLMK